MIEEVKEMLLDAGINPASSIEYDVNGSLHVMTLEEITTHFENASADSQAIFLFSLKKALTQGKEGVKGYFEKMGELLIMSSTSENEAAEGSLKGPFD